MNPQEKVQLEQFLQQLNSTQAGAKDSDANALIAESVKQQPDAAYLLVQRAMGLEMALQVAQKQMAEMQAQIDQTSKPSGFLSGINSWGRAAPAQAAPANAMAAARPAAPAPIMIVSYDCAIVLCIILCHQCIELPKMHYNEKNDGQSNSRDSSN